MDSVSWNRSIGRFLFLLIPCLLRFCSPVLRLSGICCGPPTFGYLLMQMDRGPIQPRFRQTPSRAELNLRIKAQAHSN